MPAWDWPSCSCQGGVETSIWRSYGVLNSSGRSWEETRSLHLAGVKWLPGDHRQDGPCYTGWGCYHSAIGEHGFSTAYLGHELRGRLHGETPSARRGHLQVKQMLRDGAGRILPLPDLILRLFGAICVALRGAWGEWGYMTPLAGRGQGIVSTTLSLLTWVPFTRDV